MGILENLPLGGVVFQLLFLLVGLTVGLENIIGTSEDHRSATLTEEEVAQLGEWAVEEDYEDMLRKYALLDDYGKAAVDSILRAEFNRAQEQGTLNSGQSISVSVRSKPVSK